ncbi:hypothetical protein [Nostoc sp. NMS4]|uniref:hypothetical protein n=1 Tax=Nostoc sp. NMS4 TaxID=2815390 RepID=UPI0025E4EB35|nr:hypothetical protein [Nostoc sp. NMS4]MBN3924626.1 hypothetical protein [Nostoc sp. NMS4]
MFIPSPLPLALPWFSPRCDRTSPRLAAEPSRERLQHLGSIFGGQSASENERLVNTGSMVATFKDYLLIATNG